MSIKVTALLLVLVLSSLCTLVGCQGLSGGSKFNAGSSTNNVSVGAASLSFAFEPARTAPAAQNIPVSASGSALSFTVATSGQPWLSATPGSGTTPGNVSVSVNPAGLAQGTYSGTVTVTASGASNGPQTVQVTLAVAAPDNISAAPAQLSFTAVPNGTPPAAQTLAFNASGTPLSFTVTTSGQSWLSATPGSGTTPGNLTVSVNPAGLAQGTYSGTVTMTASGAANGPQTVPVTLAVVPPDNLSVAPSQLSFTAAQNGTPPPSQSLTLKASGTPLSFTAASSGEPWLSLTPNSGTTQGTVSISVNPAGLNPGTYTSTITVSSTGATNGAQTAKVTLVVSPPGTINSVNHVIFMLQENRSFDSYFAKLNDFFALKGFPQAGEVDDVPAAGFVNSGVKSYHSGSVCMENLSPDWAEDHHEVNLGAPKTIDPTNPATEPMNGFVNTAAGIAKFYSFVDLAGKRAMGYYTDQELNYYYTLAGNFATNDKFYSPAPTNTTNNRLYALGATSQGTIHTPGGPESCPGAPVQMKGKPIFQLLEEAHIPWKIYLTDLTPRCDPKNGNFPLQCALFSTYLEFYGWTNATNPNKPDLSSHLAPLDCTGALPTVTVHPTYKCPNDSGGNPVTDYFTDVKNGTLPAFAFIETGSFSGRDEHPSGRDLSSTTPGCGGITGQTCINIEFGAKYVAKIINDLMTSPSWNDTVFFWAFDEGGGAFDHGKPIAVPNPDGIKPFLCTTSITGVDVTKDLNVGGDFNITGFRVPNLVISPFAKKNYVSHVPMDYTAILTFVEARWNLPNLNLRDKFWLDSNGQPLILDMFDFGAKAWATPPPFCTGNSTDPPNCTPPQNGGGKCDFTVE